VRALLATSLLSTLLLSGCYMYVPVGSARPEVGSQIRAVLSTDGTVEMIPRFGPGVVALSGIMVGGYPEEIPIAVQRVTTADRGEMPWGESVVVLPPSQLASVEERRLSKTRTALFVGGIAAVVLLADRTLTGGGILGPGDRTPPRDPGLIHR
jgi:hypothetical protein